jgi:hypothetical protein
MKARTRRSTAHWAGLVLILGVGLNAHAARLTPGQVNPQPTPLLGNQDTAIRGPSGASVEGAVAVAASGLSWEAAFLQGTTDFLVERAQAELATVLVARLGKSLCGTGKDAAEWPESRSLLPQACQLLESYQDDPASLFGPLVASAIRADLEMLPVRLLPDQEAYLVDTLWNIGHRARQGQPPLQLLAGLATDTGLKKACDALPPEKKLQSIPCALPLTGAILGQLPLVSDEPAYQLFLQEQAVRQKVIDALASSVREQLSLQGKPYTEEEWKKLKSELQPKLLLFIGQARVLHERVTAVERQVAFNVSTNKDIFSYRTAPFSTVGGPDLIQRARLVLLGTLDVLRSGLDIFQHTSGAPLTGMEHALSMAETITDVMVGSYDEGIRKVLSTLAQCKASECVLPPALKKYLPLMVSLSEARNSGDFKLALEAAAAPIGSWALKRQRPLFTLTGLLGVQGAWEFGGAVPSGAGVGPMGVLGLEVTTPLGKGVDMGLMLSGLDLGQLAYPRVYNSSSDTEVREPPKLSIIQVLSPGAYLRFGLPDVPFTVGFGISRAPRLRCQISSTGECDSQNAEAVTRFGLFTAVDVTVLNFSD